MKSSQRITIVLDDDTMNQLLEIQSYLQEKIGNGVSVNLSDATRSAIHVMHDAKILDKATVKT